MTTKWELILNLGAINTHLAEIEFSQQNLFQNLGLPYSGPLDGHDVVALVDFLEQQRDNITPHVLHLKTIKGKGYEAGRKSPNGLA